MEIQVFIMKIFHKSTGIKFKNDQQGMTLIELSVVLLVLVALAGVVVPYVGGLGQRSACIATDASMQAIKEAIMGGASGGGYYADMLGQYPKATQGTGTADYNLYYLFTMPTGATAFNPNTGVGWRGPYLNNGTTLTDVSKLSNHFTDKLQNYVNDSIANNQTVPLDAWGRTIILQVNTSVSPPVARLVSAGSGSGNGFENGELDTTISGNRTNDDRVLYLKIPMPSTDSPNPPCD
jgi:prepilin-type N-terminal cleavage/methylation domain-containing protein